MGSIYLFVYFPQLNQVSPQQTDVIEHHYKVYERLQNIRAETEEVCVKLKVFNTTHFSRDQSEISLSIYKLIK